MNWYKITNNMKISSLLLICLPVNYW